MGHRDRASETGCPLPTWPRGPRRGIVGLVVGLLVALAVLPAVPAWRTGPGCLAPPKPAGLLAGWVERVVDGDTLVVRLGDGRRERVRLIGVDTPEVHRSVKLVRDAARTGGDQAAIQALGRQASAYTEQALRGRPVELELDVQVRDRHGRLLAYVWHGGTLFNLAVVRDGYAQTLPVAPNLRHEARLRACQREARAAGRGLWAHVDRPGPDRSVPGRRG